VDSTGELFLFCREFNTSGAKVLTLWKPGYDIFVLWNQPKTSSYQSSYQRLSSSADCTGKLLKGSNRSDSLLVCTRKKFFGWRLQIFY